MVLCSGRVSSLSSCFGPASCSYGSISGFFCSSNFTTTKSRNWILRSSASKSRHSSQVCKNPCKIFQTLWTSLHLQQSPWPYNQDPRGGFFSLSFCIQIWWYACGISADDEVSLSTREDDDERLISTFGRDLVF
jgi:hypothetical protein